VVTRTSKITLSEHLSYCICGIFDSNSLCVRHN